MSILALLADATTPPPRPPAARGLPLADAMLPQIPRLATRTINPGNAVEVLAEILAIQNAHTGPIREKLIEVIYEPGTYTNIGVGQNMCISRSSTGDPADVIVETSNTAGGVLHWFGGPTWLRGLTLRSLPHPEGDFGPKYPLHMTNGGILTLVDCNLEARNPGSDGGPAVIGMDGGDNLDVTFVRCNLSNLGGIPANIHGGGVGPEGQRIIFYNCTLSGADTQAIGYEGLANERTDIWYVGGNITPGNFSGDVTVHADDAPLSVGGFPNYWRISLGITD